MPTVAETIVVTVTGANPSTKSYTVLVDVATGSGTLSVPLTGTHSGTDTISAVMSTHSPTYTSNPVQVSWYAPTTYLPVPSVIEIPMPILQTTVGAHPRPWDGDNVSNHPGNIVSVYYNDVHDRPGPDQSLINAFNSPSGAYVFLSGGSLPSQYLNGPFHGNAFKVTAYGADKPYHDTEDDTHNWFQFICGGPPQGLYAEYGSAQYQQAIISSVLAPPAGTAGTAQLPLNPVANGSNNWEQQGASFSLTLTIQNVTYTTIPYIPLYEGTTGSIPLYDQTSSNVFNFGGVTYNGSAPDFTSALSAGAIALSGDNTAWQGLLSVVPYPSSSPTALSLAYNGGSMVSNVDVTNLTITADDIAWFNNSNKNYDLFGISSGGGGLQYPIQIAYMIKPAVAQVTPPSLSANGTSQLVTVSLAQPISPEQQGLFGTGNTISASASASGGVTISGVTATLNGNGWITGWTMNATVPASSTNGSFQLSMNVTGNLTYLNGTTFTTGAVTYISGVIATIPTIGTSYSTPSNYSFAVSGGITGTAPNYTITGSITLMAVVFSTDNGAISGNFFRVLSGTKTSLGAATAGSPTPVAGGYHTQLTLGVVSQYSWGTPLSLGYTATDTLSTLSFTYTDTNTYNNGNPPPGGGGGGGGGCPALAMWITGFAQVSDCATGMHVDALCGSTVGDEYLKALPTTEAAEITQISYSEETCYRFKTENGAEVIVSGSTPFPTRESIESYADGHEPAEIKCYANEVYAGMNAITNVGNGPEWSLIVETECVGMRRVARLYCGGRNFAAGTTAGKYIYTHNSLVIVK